MVSTDGADCSPAARARLAQGGPLHYLDCLLADPFFRCYFSVACAVQPLADHGPLAGLEHQHGGPCRHRQQMPANPVQLRRLSAHAMYAWSYPPAESGLKENGKRLERPAGHAGQNTECVPLCPLKVPDCQEGGRGRTGRKPAESGPDPGGGAWVPGTLILWVPLRVSPWQLWQKRHVVPVGPGTTASRWRGRFCPRAGPRQGPPVGRMDGTRDGSGTGSNKRVRRGLHACTAHPCDPPNSRWTGTAAPFGR